jgi:hypothetical protein
MDLTLGQGELIKFCMLLIAMLANDNYYSQFYRCFVHWYNNKFFHYLKNSSLFLMELIICGLKTLKLNLLLGSNLPGFYQYLEIYTLFNFQWQIQPQDDWNLVLVLQLYVFYRLNITDIMYIPIAQIKVKSKASSLTVCGGV